MRSRLMARSAGLAVAAGGAVLMGAFAVAQEKAPVPVALSLSTRPAPGAVVLFSGKAEEMPANWYKHRSKDPSEWTVDANGVATPKGGDAISKQQFGDCFLHLEYRTPVDAEGKQKGSGNSGVGFMGRYEVQIMNGFGEAPSTHGAASFYSQRPPRAVASRKAGEWQTYDIWFRAPRFDADGKVIEKARATVVQNGVVVQNNEEFNGPTGIQYGDFPGEAKAGPIILQGDHEPVSYRNIWIVPL